MITGIGTDLLRIDRLADALDVAGGPFREAVFTAGEEARARTHPDPHAYLAMLFAAKEAVFKSLAANWDQGVKLNQVEITHGANGQPLVTLGGPLGALAQAQGVSVIRVSMSCDGDYAVASAVAIAQGEV